MLMMTLASIVGQAPDGRRAMLPMDQRLDPSAYEAIVVDDGADTAYT
jgi:hypothetical protein